ncbi:unnamed protein product, partial [Mesorhabditis spiculigera]
MASLQYFVLVAICFFGISAAVEAKESRAKRQSNWNNDDTMMWANGAPSNTVMGMPKYTAADVKKAMQDMQNAAAYYMSQAQDTLTQIFSKAYQSMQMQAQMQKHAPQFFKEGTQALTRVLKNVANDIAAAAKTAMGGKKNGGGKKHNGTNAGNSTADALYDNTEYDNSWNDTETWNRPEQKADKIVNFWEKQ